MTRLSDEKSTAGTNPSVQLGGQHEKSLRRAERVVYRQPLAPRYGNQHCADLAVDNLTPASRIRMLSGEVALHIAPVLAEMKAARAAIEKAGARPLITDGQIRTGIAPPLLAAWSTGLVVLGFVLVLAAFGAGWVAHWWSTPTLACQEQRGGILCYHWKFPPTEPEPASTAPPVQTLPAQPTKSTMRKPPQ